MWVFLLRSESSPLLGGLKKFGFGLVLKRLGFGKGFYATLSEERVALQAGGMRPAHERRVELVEPRFPVGFRWSLPSINYFCLEILKDTSLARETWPSTSTRD